jgi:hypothetical protein
VIDGRQDYSRAFFGSLFGIALLISGACAIFWGPLTAIPLDGAPSWYRDYGGRFVPEISDQDLFYQNVGPSVAAAAASDIVIMGPSFSAYAFDRDRLRRFEVARRLKLFNMSFIGVRGGEFSRRIIARWRIRAPLWLINVDDQFTHFFSTSTELTLGPTTEPIRTLGLNRFRGFVSIVARTLRWRYEDLLAQWRDGRATPSGLYRSAETGDVMLETNPRYVANDNKPLVIARDPQCHVSPQVVQTAREYLQSIGGEVVLTLAPHSQYCPLQAQELAEALGVEVILAPPDGYTTVDGGGHLDKNSAVKFTEFVMTRLVETAAFKRAFVDRPARAARAAPPSESLPD